MSADQQLRGHRDLKVYQLSYKLAMEIFETSKRFPSEQKYSLTDQIRRSSRSVVANIAEGFRKRQYPRMFVSKLADSDGEAAETQVWLDFARDCGYILPTRRDELIKGYEEVGRTLGSMISAPGKIHPPLSTPRVTTYCFLPPAHCQPPSEFCLLKPKAQPSVYIHNNRLQEFTCRQVFLK